MCILVEFAYWYDLNNFSTVILIGTEYVNQLSKDTLSFAQ